MHRLCECLVGGAHRIITWSLSGRALAERAKLPPLSRSPCADWGGGHERDDDHVRQVPSRPECRPRGGRSTVRTWLYGIARNVVRAHRRERKKRDATAGSSPTDPDSLHDASEPSPEGHAARAQAGRLVVKLLDALDDDKREVFVLAELEQLTAQEIADMLQENLNTVYSRLRLAREHAHARRSAGSSAGFPRRPNRRPLAGLAQERAGAHDVHLRAPGQEPGALRAERAVHAHGARQVRARFYRVSGEHLRSSLGADRGYEVLHRGEARARDADARPWNLSEDQRAPALGRAEHGARDLRSPRAPNRLTPVGFLRLSATSRRCSSSDTSVSVVVAPSDAAETLEILGPQPIRCSRNADADPNERRQQRRVRLGVRRARAGLLRRRCPHGVPGLRLDRGSLRLSYRLSPATRADVH